MAALIFILVLSFLVIIHELGHFFTARWAKMKVEEFGVGYPPRALKLFKWKETLFSLNWIPFGGFVKIKGEDNVTGEFYQRPSYQQLIVILAGATVNFVFGILAFALVFTISGVPTPIDQPRISTVAPNSPAAAAGIPTNVAITGIETAEETIKIYTTDEAIAEIGQYRGEEITLITSGECQPDSVDQCDPTEQKYEVYIRTAEETPANEGALGVSFESAIYLEYPWYEKPFRAIWFGLVQAIWLGKLIVVSLGQMVGDILFKGSVPDTVAGPIRIVAQASDSGIVAEGALSVLAFAGMLSVNLAIINIMPIPALDGGRALFITLKKIFGKQKLEKVEEYGNYFGYIFILAFIVIISIKDIISVFFG